MPENEAGDVCLVLPPGRLCLLHLPRQVESAASNSFKLKERKNLICRAGEPEPVGAGCFGPLEQEPEPLEKKYQGPEPLGKKISLSRSRFGKKSGAGAA